MQYRGGWGTGCGKRTRSSAWALHGRGPGAVPRAAGQGHGVDGLLRRGPHEAGDDAGVVDAPDLDDAVLRGHPLQRAGGGGGAPAVLSPTKKMLSEGDLCWNQRFVGKILLLEFCSSRNKTFVGRNFLLKKFFCQKIYVGKIFVGEGGMRRAVHPGGVWHGRRGPQPPALPSRG